ncbi:MAG: AMP-binding protein [Clostridia bacterium]|nr:AMP-binding protein [Clostridia bacterium]
MRLLSRFCRENYRDYDDFYKNFRITAPEGFNFAYDVVDVYAKEAPSQRALVWANDRGESRVFTFADISRLSKKAANAFEAMGVKKGDRVLVILKRRYQYWYIMPALIRLGAVVIPATHLLTKKDIVYRINSSGAVAAVYAADPLLDEAFNEAEKEFSHPVTIATVSQKAEGRLDFDAAVEAAPEEFEKREIDPRSEMLIYFTSGTTGMPKMVSHDFYYPLGHILTACFWQNLKETDLHFSLAETGWAKCTWGKIFGQWIAGASVFVYDYDTRFLPLDMARMIEKFKITTFCAPPTVFRFLIKEDLSGIDLSSLRATYIAGEPLNAEVFRRWKDITGLELREGYGQTETAVLAATWPWVTPKPGSIGKPSPHFNTTLLNEKDDPCEVGEEGEICVDLTNGHPYGLFNRYDGDAEKTSSVMYDGYYHTGDVAWFDEEGYFWFVGRTDDVIKSSGYRIGPFEVESALLEHPAVLETAITAVPDPVRGQIVKATVVLVKGVTPSEELKKELQEHVKKTTAPYKYPRIVEFVDELPKTISGKIKRAEIRKSDK